MPVITVTHIAAKLLLKSVNVPEDNVVVFFFLTELNAELCAF